MFDNLFDQTETSVDAALPNIERAIDDIVALYGQDFGLRAAAATHIQPPQTPDSHGQPVRRVL